MFLVVAVVVVVVIVVVVVLRSVNQGGYIRTKNKNNEAINVTMFVFRRKSGLIILSSARQST